MAYKDRFGITQIIDGNNNNLAISYDYGFSIDPAEQVPVLLYTPNMKNTIEHHHIELNRKQAKALHKWLGEFLNNKKKGKK